MQSSISSTIFSSIIKPAFIIQENKYRTSHCTLKQLSIYNTNEITSTAVYSTSTTSNPIENGALQALKKSEWKGLTHSTSPFVTHYIATNSSNRNVTVEDAISSVLYDTYTIDKDQQQQQLQQLQQLQQYKTSSLLKTEKIPDPRFIPLHRQLTSIELLALGSIWFLPDSAPKDPSLGTKVSQFILFYFFDGYL